MWRRASPGGRDRPWPAAPPPNGLWPTGKPLRQHQRTSTSFAVVAICVHNLLFATAEPMKRLSPEEFTKLVDLLSPALDFGQLQRFVYIGTGERLFDRYVGEGLPKYDTIERLIEKLETG